MNIKEAKTDIMNTVKAYLLKNEQGQYRIPEVRQRPILLMGPPGIGKTQIMEQIARECQIGLVSYTITHHTRQSAVGLPFIKEKIYDGTSYSVTEYTMSEIIHSIRNYIEESGRKEGILFIDEINCVSETLAPTMLQFLQCKTFGNQAVPRGWIIVAAGNPAEYNRSVHEYDFVTLDRVRRIDVEADLEVFREYARARHLHPFIVSYLELRPGNFYRTEKDVDGIRFVTARGWEDLSALVTVYEELGIPVNEHVIGQYLQHPEVALDVAAYYDLYKKYRDDYDISRILTGNVGADIYQKLFNASFDERLSCVELLISGLYTVISSALHMEDLTAAAHDHILRYRKALSGASREEGCYQSLLEELNDRIHKDRQSKLVTDSQESFYRELSDLLRKWSPDPSLPPSEAFLSLKTHFDALLALRDEAALKAKESLEHAFDFMENAFGEHQEMVVFVTDLTMDPDASRFISENGCQQYLRYSKKLMVGSRRAAILKEMAQKEIYSDIRAWEF